MKPVPHWLGSTGLYLLTKRNSLRFVLTNKNSSGDSWILGFRRSSTYTPNTFLNLLFPERDGKNFYSGFGTRLQYGIIENYRLFRTFLIKVNLIKIKCYRSLVAFCEKWNLSFDRDILFNHFEIILNANYFLKEYFKPLLLKED